MNRTIQSYDRYAKELAEKFDKIGARIKDIEKVFLYTKKENPRVLELGCAHGRDAKEILKRTSNYVGIDGSRELIKIAKARLPRAKFICETFDKLEFPKNSFDIIIDFASIMHFDKIGLRQIFRNAHQWLADDGVMMISMKEGKYEKFLSRGYGERVQYSYELNDIKSIIKGLFSEQIPPSSDGGSMDSFFNLRRKEIPPTPVGGVSFKVIDVEKAHLNNQDWFTMILRKN